jgi:hypothetical protein
VLSLDREPLGTIDGMSSLFDSSRGSFRVVMADLVGAVVMAGATAGAWWAWLGRDTTYQVDPRTGVTSGPYEQFQVVGCVLTLLLLAVLGAILLPVWLMPVVMTACFTVCWSVDAASRDTTGLWGVGSIMVLFGLAAGTVTAAAATYGLRARLGTRARPRRWLTDNPAPRVERAVQFSRRATSLGDHKGTAIRSPVPRARRRPKVES